MTERIVRVTRVLPRYLRASDPPLRVRSAQVVSVVEPRREAGVRAGPNARREAGWLPERTLGSGRSRTQVRRAYDPIGLEPAVGETLTFLGLDARSGGLESRDAHRRVGGFP